MYDISELNFWFSSYHTSCVPSPGPDSRPQQLSDFIIPPLCSSPPFLHLSFTSPASLYQHEAGISWKRYKQLASKVNGIHAPTPCHTSK